MTSTKSGPPAGSSTESVALASIVSWSQSCPEWQRDALRRLCGSDTLDAAGFDALLDICTGKAQGQPVELGDVRQVPTGSVVMLRAISGPENVNALAPGERLSFGGLGLTVVYGDNGSGKSGYTRILKKACRARTTLGETVLPNVYAAPGGIPTATIDYSVDTTNRRAVWTQTQRADSALSAVSVFDARTASVHVEQTNDLAYTPFPLKLLASLAQTAQVLRDRLLSRTKALESATPAVLKKPAFHQGTAVAKLIGTLSQSTDPAAVTSLATLTGAEQSRLATLEADLAGDSTRSARHIATLRTKVQNLLARVDLLASHTSVESVDALTAAFRDYESAKAAADAAKNSAFNTEPLDGVGSDVWRSLWESARAYSLGQAYPAHDFPYALAEAKCVLCQQELEPVAAARLSRFERFVRDDAKQKEDGARKVYESRLAEAGAAQIGHLEAKGALDLVGEDLADERLEAALEYWLTHCRSRLRHIIRQHRNPLKPWSPPQLVSDPRDLLRSHIADLASRHSAVQADAGSAERRKLESERNELADRAWLRTIADDVIAEVERRKQLTHLRSAIAETLTTRITAKSAEVAETLVTNALRSRFAEEIAELGVAALAIELRQHKTTQGVPQFRVALLSRPDARVGDVLSEGEHRCVALAAFLAEQATASATSALVFDDPVSSLDHMRRQHVALRLIREAATRQVIVFTHDIAFLFLLNEEARKGGTPIQVRSISKGVKASGYCSDDAPPHAQTIDALIVGMRRHLQNRSDVPPHLSSVSV